MLMTLFLGRDPLAAFFLIISDPADKIILWIVLPDGSLWIEFL
jgi:hypothetical protein